MVGNTVWLRLQSYSVKLLAIFLVYSGGGVGIKSHFWSKTVFSAPNNFHDVDHMALVLSDGQQ